MCNCIGNEVSTNLVCGAYLIFYCKFLIDCLLFYFRDQLSLEGIKQYRVSVEKEHWKFGALCDIYGILTVHQTVVFCNSRKKVSDVWQLFIICDIFIRNCLIYVLQSVIIFVIVELLISLSVWPEGDWQKPLCTPLFIFAIIQSIDRQMQAITSNLLVLVLYSP